MASFQPSVRKGQHTAINLPSTPSKPSSSPLITVLAEKCPFMKGVLQWAFPFDFSPFISSKYHKRLKGNQKSDIFSSRLKRHYFNNHEHAKAVYRSQRGDLLIVKSMLVPYHLSWFTPRCACMQTSCISYCNCCILLLYCLPR